MVYKITNNKTNKSYIGFTKFNVEERFRQHCALARGGSNTYFHRAIRKYGYDIWSLSVLEETDNKEREVYYISQYLSNDLYNMTDGGEGGNTSKSPNYIEGMKNRKDMSGKNNPMFGRSRKGEKHNSGLISKGTKAAWDKNPTRKKKMSKKMKGKNNPRYGKTPPNAISFVYDGILYKSIAECKRKTGKSVYQLRKENILC